ITGTGTAGNLVAGNFIGTNITGSFALANGNDGVLIEAGAGGNTVGGPGFTFVNGRLGGPGNVISGNTKAGVGIHQATANQVEGNFLGADATSAMKLSNGTDGALLDGGSTGNTVGGSAAGAGNLVSYNTANGVHVAGAGTTGNLVQGNLIGTNVGGT